MLDATRRGMIKMVLLGLAVLGQNSLQMVVVPETELPVMVLIVPESTVPVSIEWEATVPEAVVPVLGSAVVGLTGQEGVVVEAVSQVLGLMAPLLPVLVVVIIPEVIVMVEVFLALADLFELIEPEARV